MYLQEADDGVRGREGVVVCLTDRGNGTSRLILDDVMAESGTWRRKPFYAWNEYDSALLNEMSLTDDDYQRIGEALVARLLAITRRV